MNTSPATANKALAFMLAFLLIPAMALGDPISFHDDDFWYTLQDDSET